jgi:very-short-patch-repair endonuclease
LAKAKLSEADILMWEQLKEIPRHHAAREFHFYPDRKWRFDYMLEDGFGVDKIAIEIEGGAFTQGRHTRGVGFIKDMEKYNHAALFGWRVLRFTPQQVLDGTAIAFIKRVLETSS